MIPLPPSVQRQRQQAPARRCSVCGCDISRRARNAKYCFECAGKRNSGSCAKRYARTRKTTKTAPCKAVEASIKARKERRQEEATDGMGLYLQIVERKIEADAGPDGFVQFGWRSLQGEELEAAKQQVQAATPRVIHQ